MEKRMRLLFCGLATMAALAGTSPAVGQVPGEACGPALHTATPPGPRPYMTGMDMTAPMPGEMARGDTMSGQVAQSAAQKEKCMSDALEREERTMDERKR
jgi:hypothetical protein